MTHRPTPNALYRALEQLRDVDKDPLHQAIHLALPVTDVVGIHAAPHAGVWTYRGRSLAQPHFEPGTNYQRLCAEFAIELVYPKISPNDSFLDLESPAYTWFKPVRSGELVLLAGVALVTNLADISVAPMVDPQSYRTIVEALLGATSLPADLVVYHSRTSLVITNVSVQPKATSCAPTSVIDEVASCVAEEIGGRLVECVALPPLFEDVSRVEMVIDLGAVTAYLDAHVSADGSATMGYAGPKVPLSRKLLAGWEVEGAAVFDVGYVAVHSASNLRALLRTATRSPLDEVEPSGHASPRAST